MRFGGKEDIMILAAIITGYILGILPFVVPKIVERIDNRQVKYEETKENESQAEILNEWLNGVPNKVNQQDIYNEYMTGKEAQKGE